jgi:hypothetical protein
VRRGPKVTPPPALPDGFDPDDRSWHGYKRTWRSDSVWVDLRPVRARLDEMAKERIANAKAAVDGGWDETHGLTKTEIANIVGLCGEAAFATLIGGRVLGRGKTGDVVAPSGDIYEVKTTFKYWPFDRFPPKAAANMKHFPRADMVLVACPPPPLCFDGCLVVGWVEKDKLFSIRQVVPIKTGGTFLSFGWKEGVWRSVHEIMNDELYDPALLIGMPGRRREDDRGIREYIAHWTRNPDA